MTEEVLEVPKWLKELEDKRERRLKARLGHEAGAGSPCLTCEDKCPGLDLHFWRKICKNCKCGKENHDVNDDDIYGWAQFQLLGSKPNKSKKFVLPGRKDAVELDWMPKGVAEAVESYLKDLPINLLPIKGSPAALERKQLLQKQIPLHDIDPSLCHALSENEIKQMNNYISDVKQNSVGVGRIMKLNEILIANRAPMQIPQMENIILQGANRSHNLIQNLMPNRPICNEIDYQNPITNKNIHDINYATSLTGSNNPVNLKNYTSLPHISRVDNQNPCDFNKLHDLSYGVNTSPELVTNECRSNSSLLPNRFISNQIDNQNPVNLHVTDVRHPTNEIDYQNPMTNKNIHDINYTTSRTGSNNPKDLKNYTSLSHVSRVDNQNPCNFNKLQDLNYGGNTKPEFVTNEHQDNSSLLPNQFISNQIDNQNPVNLHVTDVRYPTNEATLSNCFANHNILNNPQGNLDNLLVPNNVALNCIDYQYASNPGRIKDISYPPNDNQKYKGPTLLSNANSDDTLIAKDAVNNRIDQFGNIHDVNKIKTGNVTNLIGNLQISNSPVGNTLDNQEPVMLGQTRDLNYTCNQEGHRHAGNPATGSPLKIQNASSASTQFKDGRCGNLQTPAGLIQNQIDQQNPVKAGNVCDIKYPSIPGEPCINNSNRPSITSIKDLAYSTYNPQPQSSPDEVNAVPMPINIGLIKDIEYPTVKSAVQTQNISEPAYPRKNVNFNLVPEEILPSCHKCNKMFDATALVIGIDRTDALWHADCFKCAGCNQNLADLMYFYDKSSDDIYCGRDYAKIRGIPRCQACDELIFVKEYCLAENSTFHVKHFCCFECDVPLAGQNYVMEDLQPLCLPCFEQLKAEKCNTCLKVIKPEEQGVNLKGVHFHADNCFVCKMCTKPLLGAKFLFKNMSLYCSASCFSADK